MATKTGDATDYLDLLQIFKEFLIGNGSPASGLNWVVEEERSSFTSPQTDIPFGDADALEEVAAQNNQNHDQIIFRGMGGVSPERDIYFAIQTLGLSTTGYFNWQIRGLTGFVQNSPITDYVGLQDQPGRSPPCFLALQNTTMTYWFMANDRHIKGCIKTGSSYQTFYIGFVNPFATEAEYPYPLFVGGSSFEENTIFSSNAITTSSSLLGGGGDGGVLIEDGTLFPVQKSSGWVRFIDGIWYQVKNFESTGSIETVLAQGAGLCLNWPQGSPASGVFPVENVIVNARTIANSFRDTTPGDTAIMQMLPAFGSPRLVTLFPVTLFLPDTNQLIGELDGVYWAPAAGGVTSEDTITDFGESPEVEHIVFQNVFRTDGWSFLAIRNE